MEAVVSLEATAMGMPTVKLEPFDWLTTQFFIELLGALYEFDPLPDCESFLLIWSNS